MTGSYAERAVAPASAPTAVPDSLDLLPAAALVHDGVTATGLLELTAVGPTDRVLVLGASGGMGTLLIQLAHAREARVVAVARGAAKLALGRELGADAAVEAGIRRSRSHPNAASGNTPPCLATRANSQRCSAPSISSAPGTRARPRGSAAAPSALRTAVAAASSPRESNDVLRDPAARITSVYAAQARSKST
jgi:NADPH2:quinone reductase